MIRGFAAESFPKNVPSVVPGTGRRLDSSLERLPAGSLGAGRLRMSSIRPLPHKKQFELDTRLSPLCCPRREKAEPRFLFERDRRGLWKVKDKARRVKEEAVELGGFILVIVYFTSNRPPRLCQERRLPGVAASRKVGLPEWQRLELF
jgi:hypothetical protein